MPRNAMFKRQSFVKDRQVNSPTQQPKLFSIAWDHAWRSLGIDAPLRGDSLAEVVHHTNPTLTPFVSEL